MRFLCQPSKVSIDPSIIMYIIINDHHTPQKVSLHIQREVIHAMLGSAEVLLAIFERYSDLKMLDNHGSSVESVSAQIKYCITAYSLKFSRLKILWTSKN